MHHICNCVRFCFNNNKNSTLKSTKKHLKKIKTTLKHFKNFIIKHKNVLHLWFQQWLHSDNSTINIVLGVVIYARRNCDHEGCGFVGLLVGWFVRYVRCDLSESTSPSFMKFGTDVQHRRRISLNTLERSRSMFKVKTAVLRIFKSNSSAVV